MLEKKEKVRRKGQPAFRLFTEQTLFSPTARRPCVCQCARVCDHTHCVGKRHNLPLTQILHSAWCNSIPFAGCSCTHGEGAHRGHLSSIGSASLCRLSARRTQNTFLPLLKQEIKWQVWAVFPLFERWRVTHKCHMITKTSTLFLWQDKYSRFDGKFSNSVVRRLKTSKLRRYFSYFLIIPIITKRSSGLSVCVIGAAHISTEPFIRSVWADWLTDFPADVWCTLMKKVSGAFIC